MKHQNLDSKLLVFHQSEIFGPFCQKTLFLLPGIFPFFPPGIVIGPASRKTPKHTPE
jgi:hypothetical protein